jgi:drug/metabolite transporter (DMT)-like permease
MLLIPFRMAARRSATHLVLVLVATIWGLNPPVMKIGLAAFGPVRYNAYRLFVAAAWAALTALFWGGRWRIPGKDTLRILGLGLLGFGTFQTLFAFGMDWSPVNVTGILMGTLPLHVLVIRFLVMGERPTLGHSIALALAMLGTVFIVGFTGGALALFGPLFVFLSEFAYGVHTVFVGPYTKRYPKTQVHLLIMGAAAMLFACLLPFAEPQVSEISAAAWWSVILSGTLPMWLANLLWYRGIEILGSVQSSFYSNLPPVITTFTGIVFLGESVTALRWLGMILIALGVAWAQGLSLRSVVNRISRSNTS